MWPPAPPLSHTSTPSPEPLQETLQWSRGTSLEQSQSGVSPTEHNSYCEYTFLSRLASWLLCCHTPPPSRPPLTYFTQLRTTGAFNSQQWNIEKQRFPPTPRVSQPSDHFKYFQVSWQTDRYHPLLPPTAAGSQISFQRGSSSVQCKDSKDSENFQIKNSKNWKSS